MMRRQRRTLAIGLAIAAAACSDSPAGPGGAKLDTQGADASLASFEAFFESGSWRSFEALGSRIDASGVTASMIPGLDGLSGAVASPGEAAASAAFRLLLATQRVPLISSGSLGKTFVIDPATGEYAPDPSRTGAQANGVRFILYDVDELGEPDLASEIGHVDLLDDGASTEGISLRLVAQVGGAVFLDYGVALAGDETFASVTVDGFLVPDGERLDFSFSANATQSQGEFTLDLDASLDVDSRDFHVTLTADGVGMEDDGSFDIALSIRYGSQSIAIEASGNDDTMSAVFRVNGSVFATAEGDPDAPVILGADGEALSLDEIRVLGEILEVADGVFEFFGELLEPAGGIIELAVIL